MGRKAEFWGLMLLTGSLASCGGRVDGPSPSPDPADSGPCSAVDCPDGSPVIEDRDVFQPPEGDVDGGPPDVGPDVDGGPPDVEADVDGGPPDVEADVDGGLSDGLVNEAAADETGPPPGCPAPSDVSADTPCIAFGQTCAGNPAACDGQLFYDALTCEDTTAAGGWRWRVVAATICGDAD